MPERFKMSKHFVKPTPEEAKAYADSIGFTAFDVDWFMLRNEEMGWVVMTSRGYKKMRSWKLAIQTWFRNWKKRQPTPSVHVTGKTIKQRYLENQQNES